ncbi:MAG: flagellar hook capping FlgD N-terminal domain-containing protein [Oscillospiraceae bacterium]|nr:flagellar hook capping FlgD N-terminal domain-containing protein [Oscillospiraceae bacterium]
MAIGKVNDSERLYADVLAEQKNKKVSSDMDMDDYLSLIVAEMRTQDVLNPNSDTSQMVQQLVSMTTIQAMQDMVSASNSQYSASLVGKTVIVADYDSNGKYYQEEGVVESVIMASDSPTFIINGKQFGLSNVMEVKNTSGE